MIFPYQQGDLLLVRTPDGQEALYMVTDVQEREHSIDITVLRDPEQPANN